MSMLEAGLGLERAHMGMFTELAILYAKYRPQALMEHLKLFWSRINIPKVISASEKAHLWAELVFLYVKYDEYDNAALQMMEHSPDAFDHNQFKEIVVKVANLEIYYRAIDFYIEQQPMLLNDLLSALSPRIDHSRVVKLIGKHDHLPLVKPYLLSIQGLDLEAVNNAYFDLLIEEEDSASLRDAIETNLNFDGPALARRLEQHDMLEFRRIAAILYAKAGKWDEAVQLSKADKLVRESMMFAGESKDPEIAKELLTYYVSLGAKEALAATRKQNLCRHTECLFADRCSYSLHLLRLVPARLYYRAFMETWAQRLHDALPATGSKRADQLYQRATRAGQEAVSEGSKEGTRGKRCPHPSGQPALDDWCRSRRHERSNASNANAYADGLLLDL